MYISFNFYLFHSPRKPFGGYLQPNRLIADQKYGAINSTVAYGQIRLFCLFGEWAHPNAEKQKLILSQSEERGFKFANGVLPDPFKVLARFALHTVCTWAPQVKNCTSVLEQKAFRRRRAVEKETLQAFLIL